MNARLQELGLKDTLIAPDGTLDTTAGDMALLMEAIARYGAVSEQASEEMLALLASQVINDRLPALLPEGTRIAHKVGNWTQSTHDAGIVFSPNATYVIVVLTDYDFGEEGAEVIAQVSRVVYDYYNGPKDRPGN